MKLNRLSQKSQGYLDYLKNIKREKRNIFIYQILILVGFLILWEVLAKLLSLIHILTLPTTIGWCRSRWSPYH